MFSTNELRNFLEKNNSNFEILAHDTPIISTQDAGNYFDIGKAAPTLIMETEQGLVAFILSSKRGKIDLKAMKQDLGFSKLKMADRTKIEEITGYETGAVPLVGHNLPCVFDDCLLENEYIYGGSGDELHTLKITPRDVIRLNNVIKHIKNMNNMNNFMTPPNHVNFLAKKLFANMGEIIDGSIAYLEKAGGGPTELHTHAHNHLFIVVKGEAKILLHNESVIVKKNESYLVEGSIPHSVWNNFSETTVMIGISVKNKRDESCSE